MEQVRLEGKTVIITGANTGIGKFTALEIARRGARLILACRNEERALAAKNEIIEETGNNNVVIKLLDLASFASVRRFASDVLQDEERLDILINNAGMVTTERKLTEDGNEMHVQVNHLGHFLLTNLLLPKLKSSAPSRVVIVASDAHRYSGQVDVNNMAYERGWKSYKVYAKSKTMNILFATELTKRLEGTGINVYALHPGMVETDIGRETGIFKNCCFRYCIVPLIACTTGERLKQPLEGAKTTIYCALNPALADTSGRYYKDCHETDPMPYATDAELAQALWNTSERLCGMSVAKDDREVKDT